MKHISTITIILFTIACQSVDFRLNVLTKPWKHLLTQYRQDCDYTRKSDCPRIDVTADFSEFRQVFEELEANPEGFDNTRAAFWLADATFKGYEKTQENGREVRLLALHDKWLRKINKIAYIKDETKAAFLILTVREEDYDTMAVGFDDFWRGYVHEEFRLSSYWIEENSEYELQCESPGSICPTITSRRRRTSGTSSEGLLEQIAVEYGIFKLVGHRILSREKGEIAGSEVRTLVSVSSQGLKHKDVVYLDDEEGVVLRLSAQEQDFEKLESQFDRYCKARIDGKLAESPLWLR